MAAASSRPQGVSASLLATMRRGEKGFFSLDGAGDLPQALALFLDAVSRSYVVPFAPVLLHAKGQDVNRGAANLWGKLCAVYLAARVVGRLPMPEGWRRCVVPAVALTWAVATVAFALTRSDDTATFCRFLSGFCGAFVCRFTDVMLDGTPMEAVNRGRMNAIHVGRHVSKPWFAGIVLGPLLGGALYALKGASTASLAIAALLLALVPAILHFERLKAAVSRALPARRAAPPAGEEDRALLAGGGGASADLEEGGGEVPATSVIAPGAGEGSFPQKFLQAHGGSAPRAAEAWEGTLSFRHGLRLDACMGREPPQFHAVKANYPHCFHGVSRRGEVVYYELAGGISLNGLSAAGVGPMELVEHMTWVNEFLIQRICGSLDRADLVTIFDAKGVKLMNLGGAVFEFMRHMGARVDRHYPLMVRAIIFVNAPFWFARSYDMVMRMLPPSYREKVQILGTDYFDKLSQRVAPEQLADDYGGTNGPLHSHPFERALMDHVAALQRGEVPPPPPKPLLDALQAPAAARPPPPRPRPRPPPVAARGWFGFRRATQAHLGEANAFRFDHASQQWVLDEAASSSDDDSPRRGGGGGAAKAKRRAAGGGGGGGGDAQEEIVVAAIQAAHYHRRPSTVEEEEEEPADAASWGLYPSASAVADAVPTDEIVRNGALAAGAMPLVAGAMYACLAALQTALEVVVPLGLLSSAALGGCGLGAIGVGLCALAAGAYFVLLQALLPARVTRMWTRAPLRAFRIGCGSAAAAFALLPLAAAPVRRAGDGGASHLAPAFWLLLAPLLALLATALAGTRSAASVLLQLCLRARDVQPRVPAFMIASVAEVAGALLGAAAFANSAGRHLAFPMDAGFFYVAAALASVGLYLLSMLVHMRVIGGQGEAAGLCDDLAEIPTADVSNLLQDTLPPRAERRRGKHQ